MNFHTYAERLYAASGGNPRIVRMLAASRWDPDGWPLLSVGPDRDGLLRETASVVAENRALGEDAAAVAGGAAVLGGSFVPEDVADVCDLDLDRVLQALDELVRSDFIRPPAWGGQYTFRHPVLAEVVLECMPPALRLTGHRRALRLLTQRQAPAVARARQAEHLLGSGGEEVLQTLVEGAAEAMAQTPAVAARWLRLALDALGGGRWQWDVVERQFSCDGRFYEAYGITSADMQSPDLWQRWYARRHPLDAERNAAKLARAMDGLEESYEAEFRVMDTKGQWRWLMSRGTVARRR